METFDFQASMARIQSVTGTRTQNELASLLGITQASVAEAKKRCSIPADWLLCLLRLYRINPNWIMTGRGQPFLVESPYPERNTSLLSAVDRIGSLFLCKVPTKTLAEELVRRAEEHVAHA